MGPGAPPTKSEPQAIGGYSRGCLAGGKALPVRGPGYRVVNPARRKHFGHPELVELVTELGAFAKNKELGRLHVGDLAQPRGGPSRRVTPATRAASTRTCGTEASEGGRWRW